MGGQEVLRCMGDLLFTAYMHSQSRLPCGDRLGAARCEIQ